MPRRGSEQRSPALQIIDLNDLLQVERTLLGPLLTPADCHLVVPPNQRPWSWGPEEIDEFYADLARTLNLTHTTDANGRWVPNRNEELPHFFGTLVFDIEQRASEEALSIVDGQQRLTCLCLLASCVQLRLREYIASSLLTGHRKTEAEGLISSLDGWLFAQDHVGEPIPKLSLDEQYQGFFEDIVLRARSREDRQEVAASLGLDTRPGRLERPVEARLKYGLDRLQEMVDAQPLASDSLAELSWARAINVTLRSAFAVVVLKTSSEPFSYSVFSWLNARGTELSEADKIKADLFDRSPSATHEQIADDWRDMVDAAPRRDAQAFLRHHHTAFVGIAELKTLHKTVTALEIQPAAHPSEVARTWRLRAELLKSVMAAAPGSGMPDDCRRAITAIVEDLGYSLLRPLLLAAAHRFLPADWSLFTKCVRLGLHYAFRMLTIGGEQERRLEFKIGEVSRVLTCDNGTVADVGAELRRANPDATFKQRFSEYGTNRTSIQFYVLNEIERHLSRGGLVPAEHGQTANNIEHILPKKLSRTRVGEWAYWRDPQNPQVGSDVHKLYRNRIGNLLLLEAHINKEVGDYDFDAKRFGTYPGRAATVQGRARWCFRDSALRLPQQLARSRRLTSWTEADIDARQEALAATALKVWTLHPGRL